MTTRYEQAMARIEEEKKDLRGLLTEATSLQPAEVEALLRPYITLKAVLELHKPIDRGYNDGKIVCQHCRGLCHSYSGLNCDDEADGLFPCPTAEKIIEGMGITQ